MGVRNRNRILGKLFNINNFFIVVFILICCDFGKVFVNNC